MSASNKGATAPGSNGGGGGKRGSHLLDRDEFRLINSAWSEYFPDEGSVGAPENDPRLFAVAAFRDFFLGNGDEDEQGCGLALLEGSDLESCSSVRLDFKAFRDAVSMSDFPQQLQERPTKVIACVGLGLCLARHHLYPQSLEGVRSRGKIIARFDGAVPVWGISELKSNAVGKFVTVIGNVVRVSVISAMVLRASFACPKCGCEQARQFVDGKHNPPTSCPGANCKSRTPLQDISSTSNATEDGSRAKGKRRASELQGSQAHGNSGSGSINLEKKHRKRLSLDEKLEVLELLNAGTTKAETFELLRESATTVDFQKIKLQEIENDSSEAGRIPRTVEVELHEDLVDTCIPGDVVTVSGVVKSVNAEVASGRMNKRAKASGLYLIYLEANSLVNSRQDNGPIGAAFDERSAGGGGKQNPDGSVKNAAQFTPEELEGILQIAEDPDPFGLVVSSLCPSIFGHEIVKAGLVLGLLGGTPSNSEVATRSDSHVLVVGDPGLGKSQMLHAVSQVSPRSVYVCGNTTSTTGLTVTVSKEGTSGEVGLEAGALVLSDQGTCCIDEFDKMGVDPHALLEAMEQQRISIAKAGVVASLSARCSVLAAANPIGGHYNRAKTVAENLKMSAALLSRFDLVFILLDRADEEHDKRLSEHIMRTHALAAAHAQPPRSSSESISHRARDAGEAWNGTQYSQGGSGASMEKDAEHSQRGSQRGSPQAFELFGRAGKRGREWDDEDRRSRDDARGMSEGPGAIPHGSQDEGRTLSQRLKRSSEKYGHDPVPSSLLKSYVTYARTYCHPKLTLKAARVLQKLYLTMRREARDGRSMPITMRQLESLVRLSQARAKVELREQVTEQDAKDVVDMMQEVRSFVAGVTKRAAEKGSALFPRQELLQIANDLCLAIPDFEGFLDVLRQECYLLKKGPRLFQLQTSDFSTSSGGSQSSQSR